MHRPSLGCAVLLSLAALSASAVRASPTANEFQACHRLGAALLRHCLDEAPGRLDAGCWEQSRERTTACYADLRSADARARERAEAARAAQLRAIPRESAASAGGRP